MGCPYVRSVVTQTLHFFGYLRCLFVFRWMQASASRCCHRAMALNFGSPKPCNFALTGDTNKTKDYLFFSLLCLWKSIWQLYLLLFLWQKIKLSMAFVYILKRRDTKSFLGFSVSTVDKFWKQQENLGKVSRDRLSFKLAWFNLCVKRW